MLLDDDVKLGGIVAEVDEFLLNFTTKNKIVPLTLTAIVLARLILLNKAAGEMDDLTKLLESVADSIDNKELDIPTNKSLH
jgi:hypothetical protein